MSLQNQFSLATGANVLCRVPVSSGFKPEDDALSRQCEAGLTSIVLGAAIGIQSEMLSIHSGIQSQGNFSRNDFFQLVTCLLGDGGLKFSDFLIRLAKLSDQVRLGTLGIDDGLLRLDYLIVELGADLAKFRPISRFDSSLGDLHDANDGRHGRMEF